MQAQAPGGDPLFDVIVRGWPDIVAHLGRNPAVRPLITACRPVEVRDGIVMLGFPESQPFLRDHAERKRSAIEEGITAVVGRPVGVRCTNTNLEVPEPDLAPTDDLVAVARRVFGGDLADVADVD